MDTVIMLKDLQSMVSKLTANHIFILSVIGMLGMIVMICMGHNGNLIKAFIGVNTVGLGIGGFKAVKDRNKEE